MSTEKKLLEVEIDAVNNVIQGVSIVGRRSKLDEALSTLSESLRSEFEEKLILIGDGFKSASIDAAKELEKIIYVFDELKSNSIPFEIKPNYFHQPRHANDRGIMPTMSHKKRATARSKAKQAKKSRAKNRKGGRK